jgi:hypothetical protein
MLSPFWGRFKKTAIKHYRAIQTILTFTTKNGKIMEKRYCAYLPILRRIKLATTATIKSATIHSMKDRTPANARTVKTSKRAMAATPTAFFFLLADKPLVATMVV